MSQHFIGLDLGTDSVKAVVVKQGLKGGEIVSSSFEPVIHDSNGENTNFDVVSAAERLLATLDVKDAPVYCSLPGDMVSIYKISLPVSASRRAKDVLLFELDELLPYSSDDAVFDFMEIKRTASEVLYSIAVVHKDRFKVWIETLQNADIDPAEVNCAPLVYSSYFNEAGRFDKVSAIVDIGYSRTNISIAGDDLSTSRTVLRGGRLMTSALCDAASLDFETAEQHKIHEGLNGQVGKVLESSLDMLVLEIRQTFNAHLAEGGAPVKEIYICGGSSKISGLKNYFTAKLHLPVYELKNDQSSEHHFVEHDEKNILANCLAGTPSVPKNKRFNFRKDEFAFKGDTDAVQKKFLFLGLCFLLIVTSWIFATVARYSVTSAQAELAKERLEDETFKVLGQKTVSRIIIEKKLMPKTLKKSPVPVKDSFDIIYELSKRVPERVIHDVEQLEIKPGHIKIVGLVNSELSPAAPGDNTEEDYELSPTDLIKSKLSEFDECFTSFKIPRVRTINDRQQYTMEIDSKCP